MTMILIIMGLANTRNFTDSSIFFFFNGTTGKEKNKKSINTDLMN